MIRQSGLSSIKREQKKSFIFREISRMVAEIALDEPTLTPIVATRAELTNGEGMCIIFFSSPQGREAFEKALETLKLYRPALRAGLAKARQSRYTPELRFVYDEELEKKLTIEKLLDDIKEHDLAKTDQ